MKIKRHSICFEDHISRFEGLSPSNNDLHFYLTFQNMAFISYVPYNTIMVILILLNYLFSFFIHKNTQTSPKLSKKVRCAVNYNQFRAEKICLC